MNSLKRFYAIALVTIIILLLLFIGLYTLWYKAPDSFPLNESQIQAITSFLALLIGSAATLGSAIAALKIASLGLELSTQQERRDATEFVDQKTQNAIKCFSRVAMNLTQLHNHFSKIVLSLPIPENFKVEDVFKIIDDQRGKLDEEIAIANNLILELSTSLEEILLDDFARQCFETSVRKKDGLIQRLKYLFKNEDDLHWGFTIENFSLLRLASITSMFRSAISHEISDNYGRLGFALMVNLFNLNRFKEKEFIAMTGIWTFMGSYMLLLRPVINRGDEKYLASIGTAFLHDLVFNLPDGKIIEETLQQNYSNLFKTQSFKLDSNPRVLLSDRDLFSLEVINSAPNMLFVQYLQEPI